MLQVDWMTSAANKSSQLPRLPLPPLAAFETVVQSFGEALNRARPSAVPGVILERPAGSQWAASQAGRYYSQSSKQQGQAGPGREGAVPAEWVLAGLADGVLAMVVIWMDKG